MGNDVLSKIEDEDIPLRPRVAKLAFQQNRKEENVKIKLTAFIDPLPFVSVDDRA